MRVPQAVLVTGGAGYVGSVLVLLKILFLGSRSEFGSRLPKSAQWSCG